MKETKKIRLLEGRSNALHSFLKNEVVICFEDEADRLLASGEAAEVDQDTPTQRYMMPVDVAKRMFAHEIETATDEDPEALAVPNEGDQTEEGKDPEQSGGGHGEDSGSVTAQGHGEGDRSVTQDEDQNPAVDAPEAAKGEPAVKAGAKAKKPAQAKSSTATAKK